MNIAGRNGSRKAVAGLLAAAGFFLAAGISAASAHSWRGGQSAHDPVTGYLCVTTNCTTIRLPNAYCICQKVNPGEQRLWKLKLACYTKTESKWTPCPVRPRFGTMVN